MRHPCGPQMARRLLLVVTLALAVPGVASAGLASLEVRELPLGRRALPERRATRDAVPARRDPLARAGAGRAADAVDDRAVVGLEAGAGGRRGRAGLRQRRASHEPRLARRGARLGGARDRGRGTDGRPRHTGPRTDGAEPRLQGAVPGRRLTRRPAARRACGMAGGRGDRQGQAELRGHAPDGARPSHGRDEHVHAAPGPCGRARDPALPRQGQRLERHRLQRARRPLRHGLRGSRGRHRPQRGRGPRARVQHRLVRHRGDGRLPHRGAAGRRGRRARADARLAPRPGARRPARDLQRHLLGQRALRCRHPGVPAHDLRAPGHGADDLPGRAALRTARRHRAPGRRSRPAEALRTARRRGRVGWDPLPRPRLLGTRLVGRRDRRRRDGARPRPGHRGSRRLDVATDGARPRGHALAHRDAGRDVRRGHARRDGDRRPCSSPPRRPLRPRSRPTPTGRRTRRRSPSRSPSTRTSPCR